MKILTVKYNLFNSSFLCNLLEQLAEFWRTVIAAPDLTNFTLVHSANNDNRVNCYRHFARFILYTICY